MLSIFKSSGDDLYLDLGTANTIIANREKILLNEPSLIAYSEVKPGKKKILCVGDQAIKMVKKNPGNIIGLRPLQDGVVADFETTEAMIRQFFLRPQLKSKGKSAKLVISLPYGATEVEKRAVSEAGKSAGAREVILVDEPMVAALGAGLPVQEAKGSMVIDIGGGTTEIAVIALSDIVTCEAVRIGGHYFDQAILDFLRKNKNLIVTEMQAEELKMKLATATPRKNIIEATIAGREGSTGLPKTITITSEEIGVAIDQPLREIIQYIHKAIEETPPELVSDVISAGIIITGGGSLIRDLDLRLQNEVRLSVKLASDPILSMARGGMKLLKDPELLEKVRLDGRDEEEML